MADPKAGDLVAGTEGRGLGERRWTKNPTQPATGEASDETKLSAEPTQGRRMMFMDDADEYPERAGRDKNNARNPYLYQFESKYAKGGAVPDFAKGGAVLPRTKYKWGK